jgi:Holliday junction DNA helicase RuvA
VSTGLGHIFALHVEAPADWNDGRLSAEHQVAVRTADGLAYVVDVHARAFRERLLAGGRHWVFTAHIVREDASQLFGFESPLRRTLFLEVRDIDSIGPKTAALILAAFADPQLLDLANGHAASGMKIPGVGPKTLEKLALGLRSRKERFLALLLASGGLASSAPGEAPVAAGAEAPAEITAALEKLGLRREDVARLYREIAREQADVAALAPSELIRLVLQKWGQASRLVREPRGGELR